MGAFVFGVKHDKVSRIRIADAIKLGRVPLPVIPLVEDESEQGDAQRFRLNTRKGHVKIIGVFLRGRMVYPDPEIVAGVPEGTSVAAIGEGVRQLLSDEV